MEAIQIQTPPKDDDLEMPELSVPPEDSEIEETVEEENEQDSIAVADTADEPQTTAEELSSDMGMPAGEETRDDEIVVEDQEDSEDEGNENGHEDHNSVLSSPPPESDAEANTSKTGRIH